MKGDYYRYLAEVASGDERKDGMYMILPSRTAEKLYTSTGLKDIH